MIFVLRILVDVAQGAEEYVNMRLVLESSTGLLKCLHGWNIAEFSGQSWGTLAMSPVNFVIMQGDELWVVKVRAKDDADEFAIFINGHSFDGMEQAASKLAYNARVYRS